MRYIFTGDFENIGLEVVNDPSEVEKRIVHVWSKAEFNQLVGILVPDNVESLALEYDRNIFAIKYEDVNEAEIFETLQDSPQFMQDLWTNRVKIQMHLKAEILSLRAELGYSYYYDETKDQVIQTERPDKDHLQGLYELSGTKLGTRLTIDLIEVLIQKGIIVEADLPSYFDLTTAKDQVSKVDWDNV